MKLNQKVQMRVESNEKREFLLRLVLRGATNEIIDFIAGGGNVNVRNDYNHTALILASIYGNNQLVKILIDAGAEVNARNNDRKTALYLC